jgi:hypothetical protein
MARQRLGLTQMSHVAGIASKHNVAQHNTRRILISFYKT